MNHKSLLAAFALVAVSSTAALARPATFTVEADASFTVGPAIRDHRDGRPVRFGHWVRDHRSPRYPEQRPIFLDNTKLYEANGHRWSEYTGPIYTRGNYSYGFAAITDPTRIGQVRQDFWLKGAQANTIQLRAVAGSTFVEAILVEFGPGTKAQVIRVNRDLRDGAITFDLDGYTRSVARISVQGTSGRGAAFQIFAR